MTTQEEAIHNIKQEIEDELLKSNSFEIQDKIKTVNDKKYCVEYVYNQMFDNELSMDEAIGALEEYLNEIQ